MRLVLELPTQAAAALTRRAVRHNRPVAMEAERIIANALGLADCDCQPRPIRRRRSAAGHEGEEAQ